MAALRSGLETQRGVCGNSVTEQAWVEFAANRRRGGLRGEHGGRHLALTSVPKYERKIKRATKLAAHEAYLRERQTAARPDWIPASVLHREITERGYQGGLSQLRAFMRTLRPAPPAEPEVRFETAMGEQLQVDWVEFRKGATPLHAFCGLCRVVDPRTEFSRKGTGVPQTGRTCAASA